MCKSHIPPRMIALNNSAGPAESPNLKNLLVPTTIEIRPQMLLNHFEFHKELTRKDDLIHNLKTQLQHDCESLFDYTPISFHITIPEGRYSTLDTFLQKFLNCFETLQLNKQRFKELYKKEKESESKNVLTFSEIQH